MPRRNQRNRRKHRRAVPSRPPPAAPPPATPPAPSRPIRHWTAEEDETLEVAVWETRDLRLAHRREVPSPLQRVAIELGRTYGAVRSRAALLGITGRARR